MGQYRFRLSLSVEDECGERRRYAADVPCVSQDELVDRLAFAVAHSLDATQSECAVENIVHAAARLCRATDSAHRRLAPLVAVARMLLHWDGHHPVDECISVHANWSRLIADPDADDADMRRQVEQDAEVTCPPGSPDWSHLLSRGSS